MEMITLRAVFEARETGELPEYLGSTIRGILGHCIRGFVCHTPQIKCFKCSRRTECLYVRCFSNTGGAAGAVNPYVLHVHTHGKTKWRPGDNCTFDLTLFGQSTAWANVYIDALFEMEHQGWGAARLGFRLLRVIEPGSGRLICGNGRTWLRNLVPVPMDFKEREARTVLVAFDTPVRIVSGKELFQTLPFEVFARFLYGRLSLMSQIYGPGSLPWNEAEIYEKAANISVQAQEWNDVAFTRYSMSQDTHRLELPAKIGWVQYEGDFAGLTSLLEAGKYTHVGKGTTIGFGHYEIWFDR